MSILRRLSSSLKWPGRRRSEHLLFGSRGEREAARYLKRRGYRILVRDFRCPAGQIDLICLDGDVLVFVEVKSRAEAAREDPLRIVHAEQWRRVEQAARYYLLRYKPGLTCRIDLIIVNSSKSDGLAFEHFENAHVPRVR